MTLTDSITNFFIGAHNESNVEVYDIMFRKMDRKEVTQMLGKDHNYTCVLEGLLIGASLGAAAGILFGPRAEKTLKKAGSLYSDAHHKADKVFGHAARSAETKLESIKEILGRA